MYEYKVKLSDSKLRTFFKEEDIIIYTKARSIDDLKWDIEKKYPDKHWWVLDKRQIS